MGQELCEGNLGDNIFLDGDFGRGSDDVLQINPNIAPGYSYTTGLPPDGSYSIVKRTGNWSNLWNTWLDFDHSGSDPDGYMMIVNASFSAGVFYEKEITGLCPNTLYEFSSEIINAIRTGVFDHSDPNVSFFLDDVEQYSTGLISKSEQWQKFGFSFVTGPNQESVKLSLRNNAPGGIGNDLGLDNISFRPCGPKSFIGIDTDQRIFLCSDGDPFNISAETVDNWSVFWQVSNDGLNWEDVEGPQGQTYTHTNFEANTYLYRYVSAANEANLMNSKCRVISDMVSIEVLPEIYMEFDTICDGNVRVFGDSTFTVPGFHAHTFVSSIGCDSLVHLNLSVGDKQPIDIDYFSQDPRCHDTGDGRISIVGANGGYPPYDIQVTLDGNSINDTDNIPGGDYNLIAVDRYGCTDTVNVIIEDPSRFIVDLIGDTTVRLGDELNMSVETNYDIGNFEWTPANDLPCPSCLEFILTPIHSNTYILKAYNPVNCIAYDSVTINVTVENSIYLPNIFSPNGDGINDIFELNYYKSSVSEIRNLHIYDRFGNSVSSAKLVTDKILWDGMFDGRYLETGVYVYRFDVVYLSGEVGEINGDVTLVR